MAFTDLGSLGGRNNKTSNQASCALTTVAAAAAGNLVVFAVAVDNSQGTDTDEGAVISISDSGGGNTWLKAREYTNGQGSSQAGVTVSIWYSVLTNGIASGGTITANFTSNTLRDASALSARKFSFGAGNTIAVEATNQLPEDAVTASGALDATTANIECLRIVARGIEYGYGVGPSVSGWTAWASDSTTGGSAVSNIGLAPAHNISTGTGFSFPGFTTVVSADVLTVYAAFKEVSSGPSDATLTPSAQTNTSSFYAATVAAGAVALTAALFANANSFLAPTMAQSTPLTASRFDNGSTFNAATVTPGAVSLTAARQDNTSTFPSPAVGRGAVGLASALQSNSQTFPAAAVGASYTLASALYTEAADTFHAPAVVPGAVALAPSLFTSAANAFPAAAVSQAGGGLQGLTASLFTSAQTFHAATVTAGSANLTAALFSDADGFYVATAGRGAVALTASLASNSSTFQPATVGRGAVGLTAALASNSAPTFYVTTVAPGSVTLTAALQSNTATFFSPDVGSAGAPRTLTASSFANTSGFPQAQVYGAYAVTAARLDGQAGFYAATVQPGAVSMSPDILASAVAFYTPAVANGAADTFSADSRARLASGLPVSLPGRFGLPAAAQDRRVGDASLAATDSRIGLGSAGSPSRRIGASKL